MRSIAVTGKNFGDEGKGLTVSSLCCKYERSLVVRHNGGAQSGHTVEGDFGRMIFHQIGAGAVYGADTLWTASYHPDLYKLQEEIMEFEVTAGFRPVIYAEPDAQITLLYDVLINMGFESLRGDERHGSCGMGINECVLRNEAGYGLTIGTVSHLESEKLVDTLRKIRDSYSLKRALELKLKQEYIDLIRDEELLLGYAGAIREGASSVILTDAGADWLDHYELVVFEAGQGLLLDTDYEAFAPHLTASKTGITNPVSFMRRRGRELDEAVYVTRTYMTRHGAGPFPGECEREKLPGVTEDLTNIDNEWQGGIRYGVFPDCASFAGPLMEDVRDNHFSGDVSLMITHLDETSERLYFDSGAVSVKALLESTDELIRFDHVYGSYDRTSFRILR